MKCGLLDRPEWWGKARWGAEWSGACFLAGVFGIAAWPKIEDPAAFAFAVARYDLLPEAAVTGTAVFLPWVELCCAVALAFLPRARTGTLWLVMAQLALFSLIIGIALARGLAIPCGCFASDLEGSQTVSGWSLARNAALLGVAGGVLWLRSRRRGPRPPARSPVSG